MVCVTPATYFVVVVTQPVITRRPIARGAYCCAGAGSTKEPSREASRRSSSTCIPLSKANFSRPARVSASRGDRPDRRAARSRRDVPQDEPDPLSSLPAAPASGVSPGHEAPRPAVASVDDRPSVAEFDARAVCSGPSSRGIELGALRVVTRRHWGRGSLCAIGRRLARVLGAAAG